MDEQNKQQKLVTVALHRGPMDGWKIKAPSYSAVILVKRPYLEGEILGMPRGTETPESHKDSAAYHFSSMGSEESGVSKHFDFFGYVKS